MLSSIIHKTQAPLEQANAPMMALKVRCSFSSKGASGLAFLVFSSVCKAIWDLLLGFIKFHVIWAVDAFTCTDEIIHVQTQVAIHNEGLVVLVVEDLKRRIIFRGGSCAKVYAPIKWVMDHQKLFGQVVVSGLVPLSWCTDISKSRFGGFQHLMISKRPLLRAFSIIVASLFFMSEEGWMKMRASLSMGSLCMKADFTSALNSFICN